MQRATVDPAQNPIVVAAVAVAVVLIGGSVKLLLLLLLVKSSEEVLGSVADRCCAGSTHLALGGLLHRRKALIRVGSFHLRLR